MNYEVKWDGWMQSCVSKTDKEVDNKTVFKTYTEAKSDLTKALRTLRKEISYHIFDIENTKKSEVY